MNNLKEIRELFGATQEDVARLLDVSRVTISKAENDADYRLSIAQLEKLSLFFYIGPEFFYDNELSDPAKQRIMESSSKLKERNKSSNNSHQEVITQLLDVPNVRAMLDYMLHAKVLLAKSEDLTTEQLEDIVEVNKKLGVRLEVLLQAKRSTKDTVSLTQSLHEFAKKYEEE